MSRRNAKYKVERWKAEKNDTKFVALYHSLLNHIAYTSLSKTSKLIYIYMRDYSNGKYEFTYPYRMYKNICSKGSFNKAVKELRENGLIKLKFHGQFSKTGNIYTFSDEWQNIFKRKY